MMMKMVKEFDEKGEDESGQREFKLRKWSRLRSIKTPNFRMKWWPLDAEVRATACSQAEFNHNPIFFSYLFLDIYSLSSVTYYICLYIDVQKIGNYTELKHGVGSQPSLL